MACIALLRFIYLPLITVWVYFHLQKHEINIHVDTREKMKRPIAVN